MMKIHRVAIITISLNRFIDNFILHYTPYAILIILQYTLYTIFAILQSQNYK